jgi:hypothetical protein
VTGETARLIRNVGRPQRLRMTSDPRANPDPAKASAPRPQTSALHVRLWCTLARSHSASFFIFARPVSLLPCGVRSGLGAAVVLYEVRQSRMDSQVLLFYKAETTRRWTCVIAKRAAEGAFLITAYPTDAIKEGVRICPK